MRQTREEKALGQLLRIARLRTDEIGGRLAQLQESSRAAENSIAWIDKAVAAEERGSAASPQALAQFQRYLSGAELKRRTLTATRDCLVAEIAEASAALAEACIETKKFEHLLALKSSAAAAAKARDDAASADEAVLRLRRR